MKPHENLMKPHGNRMEPQDKIIGQKIDNTEPHDLSIYISIYLKATFVDCKSVFVIHVKSYKLQRQFMLRSRERGNIQLLNGMCREAQECIRHD